MAHKVAREGALPTSLLLMLMETQLRVLSRRNCASLAEMTLAMTPYVGRGDGGQLKPPVGQRDVHTIGILDSSRDIGAGSEGEVMKLHVSPLY